MHRWLPLSFKLFLGSLMILFGFCQVCDAEEICSMTTNTLMFGKYLPANNDDTTANVVVSCTDNNPHTFCVSSPTYLPNTLTMLNGPTSLPYNLFADGGRNIPLKSNFCLPLLGGTASTTPITSVCSFAAPCMLSIYGRILAGQVAPTSGLYSGSFGITLDFDGKIGAQTVLVPVQAFVDPGCNISADQFNFGNYDSTKVLKVSQESIHVSCTGNKPYTIKLSSGQGTYGQRRLVSGANYIFYNLYLPDPPDPTGVCSSYATVWDDNTNIIHGTGTGLKQDIQVCGMIPMGQIVPIGVYRDTLIATIEWQ